MGKKSADKAAADGDGTTEEERALKRKYELLRQRKLAKEKESKAKALVAGADAAVKSESKKTSDPQPTSLRAPSPPRPPKQQSPPLAPPQATIKQLRSKPSVSEKPAELHKAIDTDTRAGGGKRAQPDTRSVKAESSARTPQPSPAPRKKKRSALVEREEPGEDKAGAAPDNAAEADRVASANDPAVTLATAAAAASDGDRASGNLDLGFVDPDAGKAPASGFKRPGRQRMERKEASQQHEGDEGDGDGGLGPGGEKSGGLAGKDSKGSVAGVRSPDSQQHRSADRLSRDDGAKPSLGQGEDGEVPQQGRGPHKQSPFTVFVGDLEPGTPAEAIQEAMSVFGTVTEVNAISGQAYGFVSFTDQKAAETAVEHSIMGCPVLIDGRPIRIAWAQGSLPHWKVGAGGFARPRGRGAGHRGGHRHMYSMSPGDEGFYEGPGDGFRGGRGGGPRGFHGNHSYRQAQNEQLARAAAQAVVAGRGGHFRPPPGPRDGADRRVVAYDDLF